MLLGPAMAQMLKDMGIRIAYPGLPDHPDDEKAKGLMAVLQNETPFGRIAVLGYSDDLKTRMDRMERP